MARCAATGPLHHGQPLRRLAPLPDRRTLAHEGHHALRRILRQRRKRQLVAEILQCPVERHLLHGVEGLAAKAHDRRREARNLAGQRRHLGVERLRRHRPVHQPERRCLLRRNLVARVHQLQRPLATDVPRDQRHDHHREEPNLDLRRRKVGSLRRHRQVTGSHEAEPACQRRTMHPGNDRTTAAPHRTQQPHKVSTVLMHRKRAGRRQRRIEVGAAAKEVARARQHHRAHRRRNRHTLEGGHQRPYQFGRQRVATLRPVHGQPQHTITLFGQQNLTRHSTSQRVVV